MTHGQRRPVLLLPFYLLALLISLPISFAQNSNDTNPFTLFTASSVALCITNTLTWSGGDTLPPYNVYIALGDGPLGNNNSLGAEWLADTVKASVAEVYIDSGWAKLNDFIRFRVEDGQGISAVAWSEVGADLCDIGDYGGTITGDFEQSTTTKNTDVFNDPPRTAEMVTIGPEVTSGGAMSNGRPTATQRPSTPSQRPSTPSSNNAGSDQGSRAPGSDPSRVSDGSYDPGSDSQQTPGGPSSVGGGSTANRATAASSGRVSQTAAPDDSSGQSDTIPKQSSLSIQAIGAIVGTIVLAICSWIVFVVWRWRRRKQPVALLPRESPRAGSTRELLSPTNDVPRSPMTQLPTPSGYQPQMFARPTTVGYEGAIVPSYDEATGVSSPVSALNTPDPFRTEFTIPQILNPRARDGLLG